MKRGSKVNQERNRKAKAENNFSSYSNSQDNDSHKGKNGDFENDVNMAQDGSPNDEEMREDSYIYNNEESKKEETEQGRKHYSTSMKEGRRSNRVKTSKQMKNSKSKRSKNREMQSNGSNNAFKKLKRTHEEYSANDYRNGRDSIEEFTRYRSEKMARDREDIVETR